MTPGTRRAVLAYSNKDGAQAFALDAPVTSVGRHPDQDLVLTDTFVSRRHAVLRQTASGCEIEDLDSSHGTYVNGERIRSAFLQPGDVLQFGSLRSMKLRFQIAGPDKRLASLSAGLLRTLGQTSAGQRTPAQEMGQLNFLLDAARRLNAGSATRDILHALLELSIQLTGVERGFVLLFDQAAKPATGRDRGASDLHVAVGLNSAGEILLGDATVSRTAISRAIESSSKFTISDTLSEGLSFPTDSIRGNSIRCIYCIPLRRRGTEVAPAALHGRAGVRSPDKKPDQQTGHLLGVLYLDSRASAVELNSLDHKLLDAISTEAATLLDNALLAESERKARIASEELAIAARIHAGLMPATLPPSRYCRLQARTVPCLQIGGDFYDAIPLPDALGIVIADVSGKGVPASIVAATLQGIIHAQMLTNQPLDAIAALINRFLCERNVGKYATLVLLKLLPNGRMEYVNCGHIQPLHVTQSGADPLPEANLVVGLIPHASYVLSEIQLAPGERILLATDGIPEAVNAVEEQFGQERFVAAACLDHIEAIFERVAQFQGDCPAQDDLTLLDLCYLGTPS